MSWRTDPIIRGEGVAQAQSRSKRTKARMAPFCHAGC
jgi:hypothetical protein